MPRCARVVLAAVAVTVPVLGAAQPVTDPPALELPTGIPARIWIGDGEVVEGWLGQADGVSITLRPRDGDVLGAPEIIIPRSSVSRMEVSLKKKSRWRLGLAIGAVVGAAVALDSDIDSELCKVDSDVLCNRGEAIGVVLAGAGLGALIGALFRTDRWTPVALGALPPMTRSAGPSARAPLSVRFSFRF